MLDLLAGVTLGVHLASAHIPARSYEHNFNPGIYARDEASGVTLGTYHNSLGRQTFYVADTIGSGPLNITLGVATGYKRHVQYGQQCPPEITGYKACYIQSPGRKAYLAPIVAPSVTLPEIGGMTPRLTYLPGSAGSSNVFHLSVEHKF